MYYASLLGLTTAIDADTPNYLELEPLNLVNREAIISQLNNWPIFPVADVQAYNQPMSFFGHYHNQLRQIQHLATQDSLIYDLIWFELNYLDIRTFIREQVRPDSNWADFSTNLDESLPGWRHIESELEENFELIKQNKASYLIPELTLDQIEINQLKSHLPKVSAAAGGYIQLLVERYNKLLITRMTQAGQDPKNWRSFMVIDANQLGDEPTPFLSNSTAVIDLQILGEPNLADTSAWVIEDYYHRQLHLYANQSLFIGDEQLEIIRVLNKLKASYDLAGILLFAPNRPDRLSRYNYDYLLS